MDADGSDSQDGANWPQDDNVVRLVPRDWLGSTDELVPFGPSAERPADADDGATAQSFWTEDSASLHAAVNVDTPGQAPVAHAAPPLRRVLPWLSILRWVPEPVLRWTRASALRWVPEPVLRWTRASGQRWTPVRIRALVAVPLALALVVIVASVLLAGTPRRAPAQQPARDLSAARLGTGSSSARGDRTRLSDALAASGLARAATPVALAITATDRAASHARAAALERTARRARALRAHRASARSGHRPSPPVSQPATSVPATQPVSATSSSSSTPQVVAAQSTASGSSAASSDRGSGSSSGGTQLPAGPTGIGSAGSNCNPKCR